MRAAAALLLAYMAAGGAGLAAPSAAKAPKARFSAVLWDVDGTLAATTSLGYTATNSVLEARGFRAITEAEYKQGCIYTTPRRFGWHASGGPDGGNPDDPRGQELGDLFDNMCAEPFRCILSLVSRSLSLSLGRFPQMS